ncbi:MAG: hypothetical protein NC117_10050 [Pseudoflavonifractor sp.]|nr:hypothetical protein [Pseudoflavonifractor sp.]
MTTNNSIVMGTPTKITAPCSNINDGERAYNIEASVTIEDGIVTMMQDGKVRPLAPAEDGSVSTLATFGMWGRRGTLNIQFSGNGSNVRILEAVNKYCEQVSGDYPITDEEPTGTEI